MRASRFGTPAHEFVDVHRAMEVCRCILWGISIVCVCIRWIMHMHSGTPEISQLCIWVWISTCIMDMDTHMHEFIEIIYIYIYI